MPHLVTGKYVGCSELTSTFDCSPGTSDFNTTGTVETIYTVYLIAAGFDDAVGLGAIQFGIDYTTTSPYPYPPYVEWTSCAPDLPHPNWPQSGSGNGFVWFSPCSDQEIGVPGNGAVAVGQFYFYAYSGGYTTLGVVPHPVDGRLAAVDCNGVEVTLAPDAGGSATFGTGPATRNPCQDQLVDSDDDGVPDSEEGSPADGDPAVASVLDAVGGQRVDISTSAGRLAGVEAVDPSSFAPPCPGCTLPFGLFSFTVLDIPPGTAVNVDLAFADVIPAATRYMKYGLRPGPVPAVWYDFMKGAPAGEVTGAEVVSLNPGHLRLHFLDGGRGDDDLQANGAIIDIGGPEEADPTGVPDSPGEKVDLHLSQYPNPVRNQTHIVFHLPAQDDVTLRILDVSGREVVVVHRGPLPAGQHEIFWGTQDSEGRRVAPGVYFYVLETRFGHYSRRMVILS
jgi:hypothetical protein